MHCGVACLGGSGHEDVEPRPDRRVEKPRCVHGERPERHEVLETASGDDVLADVDGPLPRDVRDHDVQARPVWQGRVDERRGQVEAPSAGLEHPFDEVAELGLGEDRRRQLGDSAPRDENPVRAVDPDLLDLRVVEVRLQRAHPGDCSDDLTRRVVSVGESRDDAAPRAAVVVLDRLADEDREVARVALGVDPPASDELTHLALEDGHTVHVVPRPAPPPRCWRAAPAARQSRP